MTFYETLDSIMKQDFGGRGLLASLPASPLAAVSASLAHAKRAVLLTGFPVRMPDGSITGETDGPSGTANLAAALTAAGCGVSVVTDWSSYPHLEAALRFRAPQATLIRLPEQNTDNFIRTFIRDAKPTHLISLERPGKAENGHYHSMRGEQLDDMITDSALFLSAAREAGATVISIGDGGNEMGMGTFRREILAGVPHGELICTAEAADLTLASGVSNWLTMTPDSYSAASTYRFRAEKGALKNIAANGYNGFGVQAGKLMIGITEKMDTARGLDLSICPVPSAAQTVWKNKSGVVGVWKITCDSVSGGLTLTFDCAGQTGKLALAKYNEAKKCFEQVSEKKWSVSGSILTASNMSAGIYGVIKIG